jgi:hypothetical protein
MAQSVDTPKVSAGEKEATAEAIGRRATAAFVQDSASLPAMTLRGGNSVDSYLSPEPYDEVRDHQSEAYLEDFAFWGLCHLDAASWRHYLPLLIHYALRHQDDEKMVVEGLLHSLRPLDRQPPRLASLNKEQEAVIAAFLEHLCFSKVSVNSDYACQVLEEYWLPDSLYRLRDNESI